jgi:sulfonate transport system substrate-binding protein
MTTNSLRRALLLVAAATLAFGSVAAHAKETVRISYQRSSVLLTLIKQNGTLEKKLGALGYEVSWHELNGGALLAALNTGSVDIHADVADAYALFTQAANAPLTYFAKETAAPTAQAVLVHTESPIKTVADLKGKKVAVLKGAGAHYLLLTALKAAGLKANDIDIRFLEAQDGATAFNTGAVDALVIWDPLLGAQLQSGKARVLADGRGVQGKGQVEYSRYYTATSSFAKAHPQVLRVVFDELQATGRWVKANPKEASERLSPIWGGVPPATVEQVNTRRSYQIVRVQREQLTEQERIATIFNEAGLIPRPLRSADIALWSPEP